MKKEVKKGIEKYKDLKKVQKLEKQKMIEVDIINATHQLKTPLNTIASIINNLKRDSRANNFSQEVLEVALSKIEGQSYSMKETVEYFLGLTNNKNKEPFSVNQVLEQSLQYFDEKFIENDIDIIVHKDEYQDFICLGVKQQLMQVIHVLFENAIDVLIERESNRKIITTLKESDNNNHILIIVADNGRGIPKNILKRIFDYQFSWGYNQNMKHNGIGLSIAKELIEEELKGSIVASNNNGAIFTISLPLL